LLSYPIALLAITHFWLLVKPGHHEPLLYSIALALLLVARVAAWRRGDRSAGIEVNERG
jgi:sulfoxide reductase heme-binding subunit YedZ